MRNFHLLSPRWQTQPRQRGPDVPNAEAAVYRTFPGHAYKCHLVAQAEKDSPTDAIDKLSIRDLVDVIHTYAPTEDDEVWTWPLAHLQEEVWKCMMDIGRLHQVQRENAYSERLQAEMLLESPSTMAARQVRRPLARQVFGTWPIAM